MLGLAVFDHRCQKTQQNKQGKMHIRCKHFGYFNLTCTFQFVYFCGHCISFLFPQLSSVHCHRVQQNRTYFFFFLSSLAASLASWRVPGWTRWVQSTLKWIRTTSALAGLFFFFFFFLNACLEKKTERKKERKKHNSQIHMHFFPPLLICYTRCKLE